MDMGMGIASTRSGVRAGDPNAVRAQAAPGTMVDYRDRVGQSFYFDVTGSTDGTVWGSDVYTDDSPVATAAVHAGLLKAGERGVVRVTVLPARDQYDGSTRNGVTTQPYAQWYGSYRFD